MARVVRMYGQPLMLYLAQKRRGPLGVAVIALDFKVLTVLRGLDWDVIKHLFESFIFEILINFPQLRRNCQSTSFQRCYYAANFVVQRLALSLRHFFNMAIQMDRVLLKFNQVHRKPLYVFYVSKRNAANEKKRTGRTSAVRRT